MKTIKELKGIINGIQLEKYSEEIALYIANINGQYNTLKDVLELINEYIKTDLQGKALPQCEILWELKSKITGD